MTAPNAGRSNGAPVEVVDLRKRYGPVVALQGANLSIRAGEFMSLLGASGSGKSTLLQLIAGLERAQSGQILLDGVDSTRLPPERRGIGMVFQDYALFPTMTVAANIAFPLRMRGVAKPDRDTQVRRVAAMLGIEGLLDRRPSQLSGGQQQRVAIARAIVFDPQILLLDEPLSALDKALRDQTKGELQALHQRLGVTIVYVTHDQSEALAMSNRIAVLDHGRIVDVDTPAALYDTPRSGFIASFLGQANLLPVTVLGSSEHGTCVGSAWGRMKIPHRGNPSDRPSARALAVIRPEHLTIAEGEARAGTRRIATTVAQALYNGSETVYRAICRSSDMTLTVRETRPGKAAFRVGDTMPVDIDTAFAVLVPDDAGPP